MEATTVKVFIYGDLMSQPVRSVITFCNINNIPYEFVEILISKGHTKSKEFLKINPYGKVPAMKVVVNDGNEFVLKESCTILRFLADTFKVSNHWYNRDNYIRRCKIDEYLDWHHSNTRRLLAGTVFPELFLPMLKKQGLKMKDVKSERENLPPFLNYISKELSKHTYIIDNEISIADLMLYNELAQLFALDFEYSKYPKIEAYLENISNNKYVKDSNRVLRKVVEKYGIKPKF